MRLIAPALASILGWLLCSAAAQGEDAVVPQASIPGTGVEVPEYDPNHGGWDTERYAALASDLLKSVSGVLKKGASGLAEGKLRGITAPTFKGSLLRPSQLTLAFEDDSLVVRRGSAKAGETRSHQGSEGLNDAFQALFDGLKAGSLHSKFKIVGVNVEGARVRTPIEVRFYSDDPSRPRLQVNAVWDCSWLSEGETLRLDGLVVEDYEETLTKSNRPLAFFSDVTGGVLGRDPAFAKQLAYGLDHWLARLDMRTGIKVGGWNGLAIGDANGDGLEDLYVCQSGGLPNRLFLARPDGTAGDVASAAGVDWLETTRGALFVDLDNDGDQDLVVAVAEGLVVQENDGSGRYRVRSAEVLPFAVPYSLAAADYDQDGDLDIFAACYDRRGHVDRNVSLARPVPYQDANNGGRNALLENSGEFRFRHVTKRVGLDTNNTRYSYAAAWADYDRDGDLDLYVANDFGRNNLFRQDQRGGRIWFTDVAETAGVLDIAAGMSSAWGDYNNDGWFDLYVSNMFSSAGNRIAKQTRFLADKDEAQRQLFVRHARGNSLFRNLGAAGTFDDVSVMSAVTQGRWAWGSLFADVNNDGWEDILVANGFITQEDTGDL